MPSKTSKPRPSRRSPWKSARGCSERKVADLSVELSRHLRRGDRVLLEGPLGAGKSTFARSLLKALGVEQPPEGSPTFALAHEYTSALGRVIHADFYRIRSEAEIEHAGLAEFFWDPGSITISEWTSLWPDFAARVEQDGRTWHVALDFEDIVASPETREVKIELSDD